MNVDIVTFPETRVAAIEHRGPASSEHDTVRKLITWKFEQGFRDSAKYRHYGIHFSDPRNANPADYRSEFWLSIHQPVEANPYGIYEKKISQVRCAKALDVGSRSNNQAVLHLLERWLPSSGELWTGDPAIFHYVNVGPHVAAHEAITEVYLPLK